MSRVFSQPQLTISSLTRRADSPPDSGEFCILLFLCKEVPWFHFLYFIPFSLRVFGILLGLFLSVGGSAISCRLLHDR